MRWRYAGGRPYTPFDPALSSRAGAGITGGTASTPNLKDRPEVLRVSAACGHLFRRM